METLTFTKIRDVKTPEYGTSMAAGIDFYVPNDLNPIFLAPGEDYLIPSGIRALLPAGHALIAFDKSGVAASYRAVCQSGRTPKIDALSASIKVGACVIDADYTGEIHLHIINVGKSEVEIKPGTKLVQFILIKLPEVTLNTVDNYEYDKLIAGKDFERGSNCLGSTNK